MSFGIFITLLIGFRYEVGGDWRTYLLILRNAALYGLSTKGDPISY